MTYPGGKGTLYQWLINHIPPHSTFISTHLGNCAVMRFKRPARLNVGIDLDADVIEAMELGDLFYEFPVDESNP